MRWSLSRLRPLHIALLSTAYWIGLIAVKLGAAIGAAWQVSRLPPNHGAITAGFENLLLHLSVARDGAVIWAGSVSLGALIGWVAGPPLLLALTCRWAREAEATDYGESVEQAGNPADSPVPPLPPPSPQWRGTQGDASEVTRKSEERRPDAP